MFVSFIPPSVFGMPEACAASSVFAGPISRLSRTNAVLIEYASMLLIGCQPHDSFWLFCTYLPAPIGR